MHQQHPMSASKKAETKAEKAETYLLIVFCFHSVLHIQGHKLVWHPPCSWKCNERTHCMQYFGCQEIPSSAPFPVIEGFIAHSPEISEQLKMRPNYYYNHRKVDRVLLKEELPKII